MGDAGLRVRCAVGAWWHGWAQRWRFRGRRRGLGVRTSVGVLGAWGETRGAQGFELGAQGSQLCARVVLLWLQAKQVRAQGVGALRARHLARRLSRNVLRAKLGGLRANPFGASARTVSSARKAKRLAGGAERFAGAEMRLACDLRWLPGRGACGDGRAMGLVRDLVMGAAGADRFAPGRKYRVSEASRPALQPIDPASGARVGCGGSKNMTRGAGMLGSRRGRLGVVGTGAVRCHSGCLKRSGFMSAQRKTDADQALAEDAPGDHSDLGSMAQR